MTCLRTVVDMPTLRLYRLDRVQAEQKRRDLAGALPTDPVKLEQQVVVTEAGRGLLCNVTFDEAT